MRVNELMSTDPVTVSPDATIDEAFEFLERCGIRHLPVADGERLLGLVSERDLATALEELSARSFATPEDPTLVAPSVRSMMSSELISIAPNADSLEAIQKLLQAKIGCLPVLDNGRLTGLVTERDLVGAFLRRCEDCSGDATLNPTIAARMTRNRITAEPRTPVGEALAICAAADIRHLLIMHDSDTLAGIASDRDLQKLAAGAGDAAPISECMVSRPVVIAPDAPLAAAAHIMLVESISSLPVVEEDRLVGILTITDLLDHCLTTRNAFGGETPGTAAR